MFGDKLENKLKAVILILLRNHQYTFNRLIEH